MFGYDGQWGYYTDAETGLILCTNRYYDPAQGRWLTRDSIGSDGAVNLYGYCGDGPAGWADPSWLFVLAGVLAGGGALTFPTFGGFGASGAAAGISSLGVGMEGAGAASDATVVGVPVGLVIGIAGVVVLGSGIVISILSSQSGPPPPNLTPEGAGRRGAFRAAKRASGIPISQQPDNVGPARNRAGEIIPGREYDFGSKPIRDHSGGHDYPDDPGQNRGPHINDNEGNHYDYPCKR